MKNIIMKGLFETTMNNQLMYKSVLVSSTILAHSIASAAVVSNLSSVSTKALSSSTSEVRLKFEGVPVMPKSYLLKNPNRLILDLQGASNKLSSNSIKANGNQISAIKTRSSGNITRLEFSLNADSVFATRIEGSDLVLKVVDKKANNVVSTPMARTAPVSVSKTENTRTNNKKYTPTNIKSKVIKDKRVSTRKLGKNSNPLLSPELAVSNAQRYTINGLNNVNFRSAEGNSGRIDISLANANVPVDVQRKGTKIVVRMLGAKVPKRLRRRMNVSNFGTPVKNIDAFNDGNNGTIVIQPNGEYDYQVYQADSNLTIEVNPILRVTDPRPKEKVYTGKPLSMDFQDVEIRAVLQLIADFTDLNLVASDSVSGRMTLRLQNVPWDQALDIILNSKQLGMRKNGNVIMIAPSDEINAQDQKNIKSKQQIKELAPIRTEYIQLNYAKAEDMLELIGKNRGDGKSSSNSLLSKRGAVSIDARTNTLIIQDTSEKIDEIRGLVSKLDIPVRQVMIEARVVRASDSFSKELGVKWGVLSNGAATNKSLLVGGSEQTLWDLRDYDTSTTTLNGTTVQRASYDIERPSNLNVDLGVSSEGASKIAFGLLELSNIMLDLELSALQADGRGEIVAQPKVLTTDKQKAIVASGTQIPYRAATSSGATSISFINAELSLEVTPSITPEGKVAMQLKVNSDSPGEVQANGIRAIDTNRVDTNVLVDDGQTVVLGGIFQNQTTNQVTKTPFLGDLPYVGKLFRRTINNNSKQELLIFVTPRLVNESINNVGR